MVDENTINIIKKDTAIVTNDRYKTPRTSPLIFHFEPYPFPSCNPRLEKSRINFHCIEGKDLYIFDNFFTENETEELRTFSSKGEFGKTIFADHESREKGEVPARAMDNKEKWKFFANPPQPIKELYKLLAFLSHHLQADVTTQPWELYDQDIGVPAFATNRVESATAKSMHLGRHQDYSTESGIAFGIPVLYSPTTYHPNSFVNGGRGKPWLISLMLYSTSADFLPEYGLGTVFCKSNGDIVLRAECRPMRFVLFEGDIIHSIEESKLPHTTAAWRVSYVFKLVVNPRQEDQSIKTLFYELMKNHQLIAYDK